MSHRVAGLFAGIGGIERGFHQAGHRTELLCELDARCQAVLRERFPGVPVEGDVRELAGLPAVDVITAGFPCTDLSQAGRTAGIGGQGSGLVTHVFRLLREMKHEPQWVVLENVPFMLQLDRGRAMDYLVGQLDELGYAWAYRVIDARAFGLPQRRKRVILVASRINDPRDVLLTDDRGERSEESPVAPACGFYWTEGLRGLGWAENAVPTLKGGSTIGIASPPAILMPDGSLVLPDVRDGERLQGFPVDWTAPAVADGGRAGHRWKLVGNAVSVPLARWVGTRLRSPKPYGEKEDPVMQTSRPWPTAAWGKDGKAFVSDVSMFPVHLRYKNLSDFLRFEGKPLSLRATAGFLSRVERSSLRFPPGFTDHVRRHHERMVRIQSSSPLVTSG